MNLLFLFSLCSLLFHTITSKEFIINNQNHLNPEYQVSEIRIEIDDGDNVYLKFQPFRDYFLNDESYRMYMDTVSLSLYGKAMYTPTVEGTGLEEVHVSYFDIIKDLLSHNSNYSRYLEVGTANDVTFGPVSKLFMTAVGVDPQRGGTHRMTSDVFFRNNAQVFDLILIEADMDSVQVLRDVMNALRFLSEDGIILLCGTNPRNEIQQRVPRDFSHMVWIGQVWRVIPFLRILDGIDLVTVDARHGVTIIRRKFGAPRLPHELEMMILQGIPHSSGTSILDRFSFEEYMLIKDDISRLVSLDRFRKWLAEY